MGKRRILWAAAALALSTQGAPLGARAAEPYQINVVLPLTGGASFVGQGQKDTLQALAASVAKSGGIDGRDLAFTYHDDQTSPQVAVQLTKAVLDSQPSVIMGSSLVGMCLAMAPLIRNTTQFCLSPAIHPKPNGYVFSASSDSKDQIAAVVRYYRMKGWTKLAVLDTTDASGLDGDRSIDAVLNYPENKGVVTKVAEEHFNPSDISVAAQVESIKESGAQAMIAWVTGAPAATVFRGMAQAGLNIPVAPTSGNQTFAAMHQWKSFLPKQLILASALYPPHPQSVSLPAAVNKAQQDMYASLSSRHLKADNQVATSWDPGLIVVSALRKLGPQATGAQVRSYIANLTDFPGVDGVYNFKKYPQRGLGPDSSTVTTYDPATDSWVWLSQPGGAPLK
jgi:branched-chain amino acid transport system substrate-binding protein